MSKAADLLAKAKGGAKVKKADASTKKERWTITIDQAENPDFVELCELAKITGQLEPTRKERDKFVKKDLLEQFCERWWKDKKLPQNPKIVIKNDNGMEDMSFIFQVKYRATGLTNIVPNVEDLPEDETVEDLLTSMLTSPKVGLSPKDAAALLDEDDGEIAVVQRLQLAGSLDELVASDATESAAMKLLGYIGADSDDEVELLTVDDKNVLLQTVQVVQLKAGFYERAHKYVKSAEQLLNLIEFIRATLQISSHQFAVSDTPQKRIERQHEAVSKYLSETDKKKKKK